MDRKVFYNGTILTMQAEGHTVEAVYTIGDRIAAIGSRDEVFRQITEDTERIDLEGKTLIPGFIESHAHVTDWAECEFLQFTCYHIKDIAELQDMIRENAKAKKAGEWVIGYGYNDSMVAEMRHLERADIDAACADHPVFIMHGSGHLAYVNSKALEICNIHADTPIPEGGQGEIRLGADGLPSGLLVGQAYNLALSVIPKYTVEEYKGAFRKGIAAANAKGVCSIGDGSIGYMGNQWQILRAFHELEKEGGLNLRFYLVIMDYGYIPFMEGGLVTGFGSESLQLGSIKLLLDGSIQGRTASVKEPYLGTDEKGLLHHTPEDLQARVERYHRGGCQIAIHTNGDNAIEEAIDAIGKAQAAYPRPDARHMLIHCQMASEEQLDRMAKLGIIANFFVGHVHVWGDLHRDRFIGERAFRMDPVASAKKRDMPFCLHTDLPVTPLDPILSMYAATARRTKSGQILGEDQRVSVYDALRAWTVNAAHSMFGETVKGTIREGFLADLVVLSRNPLETAPDDLLDVQVVRTVVGGKTVYRA